MNIFNVRNLLWAICFGLTLWLTWKVFVSFSGASWTEVWWLIQTVPAQLWGMLTVLTTCFYLLDWIRFRSTLALLGYRLTLSLGLRLCCVSYFVTSLTPLAELHTPAMIFILRRQGVATGSALAATVTKSIYMTLWICLFSYLSLFFDHFSESPIILPPVLRNSLLLLSLPLLFITTLLALIAFFPAQLIALSHKLSQRFASSALVQRLLHGIESSANAIALIGKSGSYQHLVCHLASIGFLLLYVLQGYLLVQFFGFTLSPTQAITIFSTSLMIAYLAPVPGSIGITELLTAFMLDPQLAAPSLAVALLLRVFCWYLVAVPGGIILAWIFRKKSVQSSD